jgi:hypothetical protein
MGTDFEHHVRESRTIRFHCVVERVAGTAADYLQAIRRVEVTVRAALFESGSDKASTN